MENNNHTLNNADLLSSENLFNLETKKLYENCELVGIKILNDEDYIAKNFGKSIADNLVGINSEAIKDENGYACIDNDPEYAELFLHKLVQLDGFCNELNIQNGGSIDTNKKLNFSLTLKDDNDKFHIVKFENFQMGIKDMSQGFEHLLLQADRIDNNKHIIKATKKLDRICKIPSEITSSKIISKAHQFTKALQNAIPKELSPEASAFMAHFINNFLDNNKEQDRQKFIKDWDEKKEKLTHNETPKKNNEILNNETQMTIYNDKTEPEYVKNFRENSVAFQSYAKEYEKIQTTFAENQNETQKLEAQKKLEQKYKISIEEYLYCVKKQRQMQKAALNDIKKNNLAKVVKTKEQSHTNQPSDRGQNL